MPRRSNTYCVVNNNHYKCEVVRAQIFVELFQHEQKQGYLQLVALYANHLNITG